MHLCTRRWMAVVVRGISLDRHGVGMGGRVALAVDLFSSYTRRHRQIQRECISVKPVKKSIRKTRTKTGTAGVVCDSLIFAS